MRTVQEVADSLPKVSGTPLPAPLYTGKRTGVGRGAALAIEDMKRHITDEGWLLMLGLEHAGYKLCGKNCDLDSTDVKDIAMSVNPAIIIVQDKREWSEGDAFTNLDTLRSSNDIFKLTVVKDAHQRPEFHRASAEELGCHGWVTYYHPDIVSRLAPYIRREHCVRTYHTVDADKVPPFADQRSSVGRKGCLLSGAISNAYPLRKRILGNKDRLPYVTYLKHPGYKNDGCKTDTYMRTLSLHKVAVCTSSVYGYSLRKIVEATACGCVVVTDLPVDDVMPEIDGNLVRVRPDVSIGELAALLKELYDTYDREKQYSYAKAAKKWYDYRAVGLRLAYDVETLRRSYKVTDVNKERAVSSMVAPGTVRPGKYRGGVVQVHVTRACDKSCFGCTQGSNLAGKPSFMSLENFDAACQSLKGYWGVVGVFGGNPATHPHFDQLCDVLRSHFPKEQRGLWCNNPMGKGAVMRETFEPAVSNLNVHMDQAAYLEFKKDWPESMPCGLHQDSRHSPPYVALRDVVKNEKERWKLIADCDINKHWSAMLCEVRGRLRAYFCEIAGAQAMLHDDYPDLGVEPVEGWWRLPMESFADQAEFHCHRCGVPLRGYGELAMSLDGKEQVSQEHAGVYKQKRVGRRVELVVAREQLGQPLQLMTDYLGNSRR